MDSALLTETRLVKLIKILNHAPVNKANMDKMVYLLRKHNKINQYTVKDAGEHLTCLDYLAQNYYEVIQEDIRREGTNDDIDQIQERRNSHNAIYEVLKEAQEFVRFNIANKKANFERGNHFAMKFRVERKGEHPSESIRVASPFIDTSSEHNADILVTNHFDSVDAAANRLDLVIWAFAFEMFKNPRRGFFCTNVVKVGLYEDGDLEQRQNFEPTESNDPNNYMSIKFPLRVVPAETGLKKKLECARFHHESGKDHLEITSRKFTLISSFRSRRMTPNSLNKKKSCIL